MKNDEDFLSLMKKSGPFIVEMFIDKNADGATRSGPGP